MAARLVAMAARLVARFARSVAIAEHHRDAEDEFECFEEDPRERDHEAEGQDPLHRFGCA